MVTNAEIQELRKRNPYNKYEEWYYGYKLACDELEKIQKEMKE